MTQRHEFWCNKRFQHEVDHLLSTDEYETEKLVTAFADAFSFGYTSESGYWNWDMQVPSQALDQMESFLRWVQVNTADRGYLMTVRRLLSEVTEVQAPSVESYPGQFAVIAEMEATWARIEAMCGEDESEPVKTSSLPHLSEKVAADVYAYESGSVPGCTEL